MFAEIHLRADACTKGAIMNNPVVRILTIVGFAIGFAWAFALDANAQDEEKKEPWWCYSFTDFDMTGVPLGTLEAEPPFGKVDIAGIVAVAFFSIEGLNRRWDWGLSDDGTFDYAVVLDIDGIARFFDFSNSEDGRARSSDIFRCRRP